MLNCAFELVYMKKCMLSEQLIKNPESFDVFYFFLHVVREQPGLY